MSATEGRPLAAVVDLGTNSARLAMASLDASGSLVGRGRWRELIRLGEGLGETGALSPGAMERGVACLERFAGIIESHSVDVRDAVATSALREASNGEEFLRKAEAAGVPLRVIGPEEEARLALAGVLAGCRHPPEQALVFDIGGGSLELIHARRGRVAGMASLRRGVVYLTERHLRDIPTPERQVAACAADLRRMLEGCPLSSSHGGGAPLFGCGGAVALAWFLREGNPGPGGINGTVLEAEEVASWVGRFAALDWNARHRLAGFEPGREDIALAGLIVLREVLRWWGRPRFTVSTGGVREGRLKELLSEAK